MSARLWAGNATDRFAACQSWATLSIDLYLTHGRERRVGVYCVDWNGAGATLRSRQVDVRESDGTLLDSRILTSFST